MFNPFTPNSDWHVISPHNITRKSYFTITRIKGNDHQQKRLLIFQFLLVSVIRIVKKTLRRIYILFFGIYAYPALNLGSEKTIIIPFSNMQAVKCKTYTIQAAFMLFLIMRQDCPCHYNNINLYFVYICVFSKLHSLRWVPYLGLSVLFASFSFGLPVVTGYSCCCCCCFHLKEKASLKKAWHLTKIILKALLFSGDCDSFSPACFCSLLRIVSIRTNSPIKIIVVSLA